MKVYVVLATSLLIGACSSTKPIPVKGYDGPEMMHRMEVIQASRQCIMSKMKPNTEYLVYKTEAGKVMLPVNVHCDAY
jgi:hypothetical protein